MAFNLKYLFSSEQCPEGIVAIAGNTLRILALEKLGAIFNQGTVYHRPSNRPESPGDRSPPWSSVVNNEKSSKSIGKNT